MTSRDTNAIGTLRRLLVAAVLAGGAVALGLALTAIVTWSEYPILFTSAYQATGDPAVAFDATGRALYATLGFKFVGPTSALNPDVLVAHSTDKGKTWTSVRVAEGSGNFGRVGDLLDKEYIAAWGDGNAIAPLSARRW